MGATTSIYGASDLCTLGMSPTLKHECGCELLTKTCSFNNSIRPQNWNSHKYEPERSPARYSYRTPASGCSRLFNAGPNQHFHVTNKTRLAQVHSNIVKESTQLVVKGSIGSFHKPGEYLAVGDLVKPEQPCSDRVKQLPWFPPHGQLSQPN